MAVVLIKKNNFKQGLPAGFCWDQDSAKIVTDTSYSLLTDDKDFGGQSRSFEVNNAGDIEAIRDQLYSKPLVTVTKCSKRYKVYRGRGDAEGNREVEYLTMTDDFVVVLDTSHPDVRKSLDELFEKAKKLLSDNAKFVVVFDLDESAKLWYAQVPHENSDGKTAQAMGASFYLVHGAKPQGGCAGCFGCEQPAQKAMWVFCFPCCLVTGVPYLVCRKCIQNIKDVKISTRYHTREHNAVSPPGTNLMSLFQPATVVTSQYPNQQFPPQPYGQQQYPQPPPYPNPVPQYGQPPMTQPYSQQQQYPQPYPAQYNQPGYPVQEASYPTQY